MAWFVLARALFVGAVSYSAFLLRPVSPDPLVNLAFGLGLSILAVVFEWQLRDTSVTHMLGALLGGATGLVLAKGIGAALFWIDPGDQRVAFLHSFILLLFPYLGVVGGGRKGEWLEPARMIALFRSAGPERHYKILDTSVIDRKVRVSSIDAARMCSLLAQYGIFAGQSSGAYLHAVYETAKRIRKGVIVTLLNDIGERYMSTGLWEGR